ncbi:MAG: ankyrin repeat domain-containing protein [Bacteroidetes bacterium]|nr:ankyrin repeat domain-containing protein [Bacteroidota bacterium]
MKKTLIISLLLVVSVFKTYAQDMNSDLLEAIKYNSYPDIVNLINKGANTNIADENGATALMWAIFKSDLKTVKYLVTHGAVVTKKGVIYLDDDKSVYYGSPICIAAGEGKLDILKFLHEDCKIPVDDQEVNPTNPKAPGWTALQWACVNSRPYGVSDFDNPEDIEKNYAKVNEEVVDYLIDNNANLNYNQSEEQNTPLLLAILSGKDNIVQVLLNNDAEVSKRNSDGNTAMHLAAMNSKYAIILQILQKKGDVNVQNNEGYTPSMFCVSATNSNVYDRITTLRILFTAGADFSIKNSKGEDVIKLAELEADSSVVSYVRNPDLDYAVLFLFNREKEVYDYVNSDRFIPNKKYVQDYSLLDVAAIKNKTDLIELLLSKGENINSIGYVGMTPLMNASYYDKQEALETLINHGANVDYQIQEQNYNRGKTALHFAVEEGYLPIAIKLINNDANPNLKDDTGNTPLHYSAEKGFIYITKYLLKSGAKINESSKDGSTPLMLAAENNNLNVVKLLTYNKADLKIKNSNGETVLDIVTENKNAELQRFLVSQKYSLSDIVEWGELDDVVEALKIEQNVNVPDDENWYPIHFAVKSGSEEVLKLLIAKGADINVQEQDGYTPLMLATFNNYFSIVKILVYNHADLSIKNKVGQTVMDMARIYEAGRLIDFFKAPQITPMDLIELGYEDDVIKIITSGIQNINKIYSDSTTLLQTASYFGQTKVVKALISKGADANMIGSGGSAICYAIRKGKYKVVELLADVTDLNLPSTEGWRPLHYAAKSGNFKMMKLLISKGANINAQQQGGYTPLMIAAKNNNTLSVKLLIYNHADASLKNLEGNTALDLAMSNNSTETVKFLKNPQISPFDLLNIGYLDEVLKQVNENVIDVNLKNENDGLIVKDYILFAINQKINDCIENNDTTKLNAFTALLEKQLENVVYTASVVEGDHPAYNKGLRGTYYILSYGDFTIDGNNELFSYYKTIINVNKSLTLMKEGKISSYSFEPGRIGISIKTVNVPIEEKRKLIDDYKYWKQKNK